MLYLLLHPWKGTREQHVGANTKEALDSLPSAHWMIARPSFTYDTRSRRHQFKFTTTFLNLFAASAGLPVQATSHSRWVSMCMQGADEVPRMVYDGKVTVSYCIGQDNTKGHLLPKFRSLDSFRSNPLGIVEILHFHAAGCLETWGPVVTSMGRVCLLTWPGAHC